MADLYDQVDDALEQLRSLRLPLDKLSVLNGLYDRIERNNFEVGFLEGRMENLLELICIEDNVEVRGRMFDVVEKSMMRNLSIAPSLDVLVPYLSDDEPGLIAGFLLLIPLSGQGKYVPLARKYLEHPNAIVRQNAEYALKYLPRG